MNSVKGSLSGGTDCLLWRATFEDGPPETVGDLRSVETEEQLLTEGFFVYPPGLRRSDRAFGESFRGREHPAALQQPLLGRKLH